MSDYIDWIEKRLEGTLDSIFDTLIDEVARDVKRISEVPEGIRRHGVFMLKPLLNYNGSGYEVSHRLGNNTHSTVFIVKRPNSGEIEITQRRRYFSIKTSWNTTTNTYSLIVDGKPHTFREVRERALGYLFFGKSLYPDIEEAFPHDES